MQTFYGRQQPSSSPAATRPADLMRRRPERVTFTMPWALRQRLQHRADEEGRSLSGLIAYILEGVMPRATRRESDAPVHHAAHGNA